MAVGAFFLVTFTICPLACLFDAEFSADGRRDILLFSLVFDAFGIMLIIFSIKRSRLIREFKKYVSVIGSGTKNQQGAARPVMQTGLLIVIELKKT